MNKPTFLKATVSAVALALLVGCGGGSEEKPASAAKSANPGGLTDWQMTNGVGPLTSDVQVGPGVDEELAATGSELFETKCSACHKLDERYVGPPLRMVTEKRTPTYIMNMILDPEGMVKKHPEARKMLAQYMTPMTNQNVSEEQARALLEYLRQVDAEK